MSEKHLIILGAGSVGKRHLINFSRLECKVSAMDPRPDRLSEASESAPIAKSFCNLNDAFAETSSFSGVVICSPPKFHIEQSVAALKLGLPVFLEKPLSPDLKSASLLLATDAQTEAPLLLGYTYRWWPPLNDLKKMLERGVIGRVLSVRCVMSAHLADWHPWERYQDFFMSSKALGGGALLDESHFIDLMLWLFGMPTTVFADVQKLSSLEIETDDNVDAIMFYADGLRIYMHLDLYGRPHEKFISITGEEGTLNWSFEPNRLRLSHNQEWTDTEYDYERNDMFINAEKEFLRIIEKRQEPSCTVSYGYDVLRVIEAMRQSSTARKIVLVK